jgi:hypothetical protein
MLKDSCCDLNCEVAETVKGNQFYDEIDPFTEWRIGKVEKEKKSESKLR